MLISFVAITVATINISKTKELNAASNSSYYSEVGNLSGDALLEKLASISLSNHKTYTSYDSLRTHNAKADKDPNNSSNVLDFYTRISVNGTWDGGDTYNREHVWCQNNSGDTFGTTGAGADIRGIVRNEKGTGLICRMSTSISLPGCAATSPLNLASPGKAAW